MQICFGRTEYRQSIYELQGFSELHYYLKAEHEFTPAEVEALLSFQDPLDVARWCWEENTHAHSFPICELLEEIQADRKFPKELSEPEEQNRKYLELMSLVGKDYYIYREKLEDCSNRELIDRSEEIASVMAAYRYLTGENSLTAEEIDYLLRFDRPLVEVVKYCPARPTQTLVLPWSCWFKIFPLLRRNGQSDQDLCGNGRRMRFRRCRDHRPRRK